jgi:kynureninase
MGSIETPLPIREIPVTLGRGYAESLDAKDPLREFRDQFIIPSKKDLVRETIVALKNGECDRVPWNMSLCCFPPEPPGSHEAKVLVYKLTLSRSIEDPSSSSIYFCGNSLGLQPKITRKYIDRFLQTWATKAVLGHFTSHHDELSPRYTDADDTASKLMAPVVGALPSEVAVMDTLTTNIHLLMASFYKPTKDKYKIILEGKAFPSDHVRHAAAFPVQEHTLLISGSSR